MLRAFAADYLRSNPDRQLVMYGECFTQLDRPLTFPLSKMTPPPVREVAVFCGDSLEGDGFEYHVFYRDSQQSPLRCNTVAQAALDQAEHFYVIPGEHPQDDVVVPHNPFEVVAGLGGVALTPRTIDPFCIENQG